MTEHDDAPAAGEDPFPAPEVSTPDTGQVPDEISRSVRIAAPRETVWALITEPGWYINDGEYREHAIVRTGDVATVTDPVHGEFTIATEHLDPPHRAGFRWLGGEVGPLEDFPSTTVEFTLQEEDGGTLLTVRERGFAGISEDPAVREQRHLDNLEGWEQELEVARTVCEARAR